MTVPAHLLLGPERHGVRVLAGQLADELGAPTVQTWADAERHRRVHVHATDRLADPRDVRRLASTSTVSLTLHDVPQQTDGDAFDRRRAVYRELLAAADAWAVSSRHEHQLVTEHLDPGGTGLVAPLPIVPTGARPAPADRPLPQQRPRTAAVFGFVYPGKGHRELIDAAAAVRDRVEVTVLALGAVAPGHAGLVAELTEHARARGVGFQVTGHLEHAAVDAWLRRVDVGVCGHRNVSASGSTNQWVAAGRRPLVRDGRYARELTALRPHCYRLYSDCDLAAQLAAALSAREDTWLAPDVDTRPHLHDTARRYLDWWATW